MTSSAARDLVVGEVAALKARLAGMKPFALQVPMVPAAAPSNRAIGAIEEHLASARARMHARFNAFERWARSAAGQRASAEQVQRAYSLLRLQFLAVTNRVDIFDDALSQRSQHGLGERLAGLDVLAEDALAIPGEYYEAPPVLCFLERGHGAAIRRARTRLPGGALNPVAVIQVPRERMIGSGIGSSLVHEVGHQAAALLDLVNPLREKLRVRRAEAGEDALAWHCFERWISEIVADFWAVARLGVSATLGLMAVVSLPRAFVFRTTLNDPHPTPWLRVKISAAIGRRLFPDPQWERVASIWECLYPPRDLAAELRPLFASALRALPEFAELLAGHRPAALAGATLADVLPRDDRKPRALRHEFELVQRDRQHLASLAPTRAFATLGQARLDGRLDGALESRTVDHLLRFWALRATSRVQPRSSAPSYARLAS